LLPPGGEELRQILAGAVIVDDGRGLMGMLTEPGGEVQPAGLVTVTLMFTDPDAPAVKVIFGVPAPETIAPFETDQLYVAPTPPLGTDAEPVAPAQIGDGASVITADGSGLTLMVAEPDAVPAQAASDTAVTE